MTSLVRDIALIAYPQFTALDLLGPHHVLSMTPNVRVHIVARSLDPVVSDLGLVIKPSTTFDTCPAQLTAVVVPGGTDGTLAAMQDASLQAFLRDRGAQARWICSVCTGSLVLGAAGLLRGYQATSHWATLRFLAEFGATPVAQRVVRDRNRLTGAGVTAGLDFGLTLVAELSHVNHASKVQLLAEYDPAPPFQAGTPAKAGPQLTAEISAHLSRFLSATQDAVRTAGKPNP